MLRGMASRSSHCWQRPSRKSKKLELPGTRSSKGCWLPCSWATSTFCQLFTRFVLSGIHISYLVSQDRDSTYFLLSGPCWTLGKCIAKPQFNTTQISTVSDFLMCSGRVIIPSAAFISEESKAQRCCFPKENYDSRVA